MHIHIYVLIILNCKNQNCAHNKFWCGMCDALNFHINPAPIQMCDCLYNIHVSVCVFSVVFFVVRGAIRLSLSLQHAITALFNMCQFISCADFSIYTSICIFFNCLLIFKLKMALNLDKRLWIIILKTNYIKLIWENATKLTTTNTIMIVCCHHRIPLSIASLFCTLHFFYQL